MISAYKSLINKAKPPQNGIIELSMALVASAVKMDKESYCDINERYLELLKNDLNTIKDDFTLWMIGRQYYSTLMSGIPSDLDLSEKAMKETETRKDKKSNYLIWAIGYFSHKKDYYTKIVDQFDEMSNSLDGNSRIWADVLFLSASAYVRDQDGYQAL